MARSSRSASPARKKEALQSLDIAKQEQEHSVPLQEKAPEKYSVYLPEQPVSSFSSPCTSPKVVDSGQEWGVSQSMPVTPSAIERRNSKDYGRHSSPKGSAGADDALRSKLQENGGVMSLKTFRHMYEEQLAQDCGIVSEPRHSISSVSGVFLGENSFELTSSEINSLQSPEEPVNRLLGTLAAPLWLSITGIMPYTKHGTCLLRNIHFKCVAFAVLLGVCFYVYELVDLVLETDAEGNNERPFCEGRPCMQAWLICDLTLALGALVGLFAVQKLKRSNLLGACDALLVAYANNQGLLERWWSLSRVELIAMLALWICMVFERLRSMIANMDDGYCLLLPGVHVVIFACVSCLLMAISYCLLHVCCVLEVVIDSFGISVVECSEFGEAVRRWNVLQAVIRRASASVAFAYLVLLTSAMIAFVGPLMQSYRYAAIPAAFASLAVARFSLRAGAISYKCDRVPSLINSLSFGQDIDYERQYVVEYIIHSSAGFYIFEVRITVEMVLKFAYFSSALTLAVITKMISP